TFAHRDLGGTREVTREHERALRDLAGHTGRLRDRVHHQPGERALPQLAGEEPSDEVRLLCRGPAEELAEDLLALRRRSASRRTLNLADRAIELLDGEGRLLGRRSLDAIDRRVADADSALSRNAGEETDCKRDLARIERLQQVGEDPHLPQARARAGHVPRRAYDVGEQGHRSTGWTSHGLQLSSTVRLLVLIAR